MQLYDHDDNQREKRREDRYAQLGSRTPSCGCGETDPFALTGMTPNIVCYECQAVARGHPWVEDQHPAGRANLDVTVAMPGNDHRIVDDRKHDWPRDTLRNPDGSPLLQAAACLRGWVDTLRLIIDRTVVWIPVFLETLDTWLRQMLGEKWWDQPPFAAP
jgi:hypothetical protein